MAKYTMTSLIKGRKDAVIKRFTRPHKIIITSTEEPTPLVGSDFYISRRPDLKKTQNDKRKK